MNNWEFGTTETKQSNRVYLNLRTGKLSETSREEKPGFKPFTTRNASGQEYHFFARTHDDLTGYIKDIVWNEHEYDGKKIVGWNLHLDAGEKEYVLQLNSSDRPYQTVMQILPNVDFSQPVRVIAFMGKSQTGKPQKVLLLTQNPDRTAKDWVKSAYEPKWMSKLLAAKVKDGSPLTDDEKRNVAYTPDGKPDGSFPYIREKADGTWSFDAWTDFLIEKVKDEVIPSVKAAANIRGVWYKGAEPEDFPQFSGDDDTGFEQDNSSTANDPLRGNVSDDQIPF